MKTKLLTAFFMLVFAFFAKAEKTWRHDHSACEYNGEKIDLELRSRQQYAVSDDDDYGESMVFTQKGKSQTISLDDSGIGRFRLINTPNSFCTKALALPLKNNEIAFFLLTDNRPFAGRLVVLTYNTTTQETDIMGTKIQTRSANLIDGKIYFQLAPDDCTEKSGKITIESVNYQYVEKTLSPWIAFDGRNFRLDRDMTFEKSDVRELIKRPMLDDLNEFKEIRYRMTVQGKHQRRCLSLSNGDWNCQ